MIEPETAPTHEAFLQACDDALSMDGWPTDDPALPFGHQDVAGQGGGNQAVSQEHRPQAGPRKRGASQDDGGVKKARTDGSAPKKARKSGAGVERAILARKAEENS
ncbi:hypothetical protein B0H10DRAFT_2431113 [Mycena sp. CBHHK59/15]|nr:hypothetical protein B0H10DRAFT_2431113 [Mycena sp. CBHHK59/15]